MFFGIGKKTTKPLWVFAQFPPRPDGVIIPIITLTEEIAIQKVLINHKMKLVPHSLFGKQGYLNEKGKFFIGGPMTENSEVWKLFHRFFIGNSGSSS